MRGAELMNPDIFSYADIDARIPKDHAIRRMRVFIENMQNKWQLRSPAQLPAQPDHVLDHKTPLVLRYIESDPIGLAGRLNTYGYEGLSER